VPEQETHHPRGLDVCIDCGKHVDARVHHTPDRIAGKDGPAIGARMRQDPMGEGATLIAAAMKPEGFRYGWGPLADTAYEALRDLVAAGWTPPAAQPGDDENAKLRVALDRAEDRLGDLGNHIHRLQTEEFALGEFRSVIVHNAFERPGANLKADAPPQFNAKQVIELFRKLLKAGDKAAESARKQRAEQGDAWKKQVRNTRRALIGLGDED
jgi:hypothetical protein